MVICFYKFFNVPRGAEEESRQCKGSAEEVLKKCRGSNKEVSMNVQRKCRESADRKQPRAKLSAVGWFQIQKILQNVKIYAPEIEEQNVCDP